jgi:hypothetical protein
MYKSIDKLNEKMRKLRVSGYLVFENKEETIKVEGGRME